MSGRTIAIGDIHGCLESLKALIDYAGLTESDTLVTLGDYVDRGPDSRGVIECLLGLRGRMKVIALMGNHEVMMLEARQSHMAFMSWLISGVGAIETMASYGREDPKAVPPEHWAFIESGVRHYETETHFFVHANARPDVSLDEQDDFTLFWQRFDAARPHANGKMMVCGHTSQQTGLPVNLGHAVCIDTWACGEGWLTALDVGSGHYWQTNERGRRRSGDIGEFLKDG